MLGAQGWNTLRSWAGLGRRSLLIGRGWKKVGFTGWQQRDLTKGCNIYKRNCNSDYVNARPSLKPILHLCLSWIAILCSCGQCRFVQYSICMQIGYCWYRFRLIMSQYCIYGRYDIIYHIMISGSHLIWSYWKNRIGELDWESLGALSKIWLHLWQFSSAGSKTWGCRHVDGTSSSSTQLVPLAKPKSTIPLSVMLGPDW